MTTPLRVDFYLERSEPAERNELPPAGETDYTCIRFADEQFGGDFIGE